MILVRVCFLLLVSTMVLAQSNPVPPVNQALFPKSRATGMSQPDPAAQVKIVENYGKLPLSFEANHGQTDAKVKFLSRGSGYTLFLTSDEAVFALRRDKSQEHASGVNPRLQPSPAEPTNNTVLRMKLVNANSAAKVAGTDQLLGKSNYFLGNDPKRWWTNVPTYAKVKYEGIYSGIDLVYYGNQRQLEYDFVVAPGADPHRIQFDIRGAKNIRQDKDGDLVLQMADGEVRWHKPQVYQEKSGTRQEIAARYAITHTNRVGFEVRRYDTGRPLYIDPLIYSTYLGGSGQDIGYGITVDSSGNAYVTGLTASTDFPTMNPLQAANGGGYSDAFVAKLNTAGSALVYSTYLGGNGQDIGQGVAVDSSGNAYVTGITQSANFPTMNALQPTCGDGGGTCPNGDAFVTKLNSTGSALVYSTYLGGSNQDFGWGVAVDSSGDAYVTGYTLSTDFPTVNPLQPVFGGVWDAFVAKLNPSGSALVYSTYLGGGGQDIGYGIAVDNSGDAYVTGITGSSNFPTMNPLQPAYGGSYDAFVSEINSSGSALVYSTYLGGSGYDQGNGIAVDGSGNAHVTGYTASTNFPTVNPMQPAYGGGTSDAFVSKLDPAGSALVYSTYLGGSLYDYGQGIAVDSSGNAYVTGSTGSANFPTMNPLQPTFAGGNYDAFVSEINSLGSALLYSTYLGGSSDDGGLGIAVDDSGDGYVTGYTTSTNFPTVNPLQPTYGGGQDDAFVSKINTNPSPAVSLVPPNLNFGNQTVGITSPPQVSTLTNIGDGTLKITSIGITGPDSADFARTHNCPGSLAAHKSCTIRVTFKPTTTRTRTASVNITDNAPDSPQSLSLSGVGVLPAVMLSPTSLTFATQVVFTTSKAKPVKLTNTGLGVLTIKSIAVTGPFSQTHTCGTTVNPSGSCTISVTFKPTTIGTLTGSISVTDNAPGSPQKLPLKGTGTYIQLAPTSVNFGNQPVGTTSLAKMITLSNKGHVTVNITSIGITGVNAGDFSQTNTCGTSVASGASCFIKVKFKPTATGARSATVSVSDNGGGTPQKVGLIGRGT